MYKLLTKSLIVLIIPVSLFAGSKFDKELKSIVCGCNISLTGEYLTCLEFFSDGSISKLVDAQRTENCYAKAETQESRFENKKAKYIESGNKAKERIYNATCGCINSLTGTYLSCNIILESNKGKFRNLDKFFELRTNGPQAEQNCSASAIRLEDDLTN